jgi:hypothetical protein
MLNEKYVSPICLIWMDWRNKVVLSCDNTALAATILPSNIQEQ